MATVIQMQAFVPSWATTVKAASVTTMPVADARVFRGFPTTNFHTTAYRLDLLFTTMQDR
jgi:hypothetical protein